MEGNAKCGCFVAGAVQLCPMHAAAPELLNACKAARKELSGISAYLSTCDPAIIAHNLDGLVASLKARLAIVEAAIGKAGE
jgi:hypothetical protein